MAPLGRRDRPRASLAESAVLTPMTAESISSLMEHADNLDLVATAAASLSATPLE